MRNKLVDRVEGDKLNVRFESFCSAMGLSPKRCRCRGTGDIYPCKHNMQTHQMNHAVTFFTISSLAFVKPTMLLLV